MKYAVGLAVMVLCGFFAFQKVKPKPEPPPPPPPPPPPAILMEPAPVIDEAEHSKIIKSASDQDPEVRWQAMLLLDKMQSPKAMPIFYEKLQKDPEMALRMKIATHLGTKKGPEVAQNLIWALKDIEPEVRREALLALDHLGDYASASAITDSLKDGDESVRIQALKTLNSLQDKRAKEIEEERKKYEEAKRQAEEAARAAAEAANK